MAAIEAIRTATINAAKALGLSGTIGRIAIGLSAELIVLGGDPLADLTCFSAPVWVVAQGGIVLGRRRTRD